MNEIKISSTKIKSFKNKQNNKFHPYTSHVSNKKSFLRVLSTGNINNPNPYYSKKVNIYKNYSFLPSLNNSNNFKVKIKKNILNNSAPKKNHFKIELEQLNDQNANYKKTIIKLQSEIFMIKRDTAQKEYILNSMNNEIENIINENEEKYDLNVIGPIKLEEKNKFILIKKMKNRIKEAEQELIDEIQKNKNLRKNVKFTKYNELELENKIINKQKEKILLLIENSKELKNNQNKELNQNILYNSNLASQKDIINNFEEKLKKLNEEEKNLQHEIVNYESMLNKTNDKFKIIKLKQISLKNQNKKLNKEKNDFNNENSTKNENNKKDRKKENNKSESNKKDNNKNENNAKDKNKIKSKNIDDNCNLEILTKKLSKAKKDYQYNKIKNEKTIEKLNNIKKNYNSSLEQYKKVENKNPLELIDNDNDKKYNIDNKVINNEEKINDLKKIYQENRDKENELEKYLSSYQEAIQKMNKGDNINIDNIRKNILKIIKNQKNIINYNIINEEDNKNINNNTINNLNNENKTKSNKNEDNLNSNNDIILSKNNPYYIDAEENDPIISKKFTNEQFRQFTYVLFKNFESKNINYEKGKNEIVTPLINYYNNIINDKKDENIFNESNIQEKLSIKFTEIILNLLNCNNEQDKIRLSIFFHAIYYDKINNINNNENNNKINNVTNYFLSLFNYIHEYTEKDEHIIKQRIKSKYSINFIKLKNLLKEYLLTKNKSNKNEDNEYISIQEIKYILDNNVDIRLKERYIEYIIYCMKQFDDNKTSLFDLKISNLDDILNGIIIDNKENNYNDKENQTTESIEEISPEDYNKNIYSVLFAIKQLMMDEKKSLRQLFVDSIVTISKPNSDIITLDSFNDELNKRNINLNYLQMSCINNKYCVNEELHALDIKQIENDINNLKENKINNYL